MLNGIVAQVLQYKQFRISYYVYSVKNRFAAKATIPIHLSTIKHLKQIELSRDYLIKDQAEAAIVLAAKSWIDDFVTHFDY